jgi:RHS repeat-associated protein
MSIKTSLCYDPLDRLVGTTPFLKATLQDFYNGEHLSTAIHGPRSFSIFRSAKYLHAQLQIESDRGLTSLLATDVNCSVLLETQDALHTQFAYMPYGYRHPVEAVDHLLAFNGERLNAATGHYLLGNGRRAFNPVLMRFNSPDKLSPFDRGGVNAYAYCKGDPINFSDPSGEFFQSILGALKVVQNVLKTGWKSYSVFVRPAGEGMRGVGTVVSRAGYITTAAGWGLQTGGFAVGATVSNVGVGLIGTGKTLKVAHKLVSAIKSGKVTDALRSRVRQLRRQTGPAVLDPEKVNIRTV